MESKPKELTVCDVMGDWGLYQTSVTLFAVIYSALFSVTVVVGPIWTPDMSHICLKPQVDNQSMGQYDFSSSPHECTRIETFFNDSTGVSSEIQVECTQFVYDDEKYGKLLTNSFDLVCSREWLKSFLSSSALAGMLLSSVTLGLFSDRFGRMRCIEVSLAISIGANVAAILSHNYILLNVCFLMMSYAQVGACNALCTLVMEATSPRFRFIPVFEYGFGWGLGVLVSPFMQNATKNYVHFLIVMLVWQLLMLPWMHWGVFESIRWLLSEGHVNRAQIELQRACRMNGVRNGARLATEIANIQTQQMRKASMMMDAEDAPARLARALEMQIEATTTELDTLSAAIKQSFGFIGEDEDFDSGDQSKKGDSQASEESLEMQPVDQTQAKEPKMSITTQALMQLAMKYRKALQQEEESKFFLIQMFHRKLWKRTLLLMLLSVMVETSYYGFIQANKFVGDNVTLNYAIGALGEFSGSVLFMVVLWAMSRRMAIITPTSIGSLMCLIMAITYHLIPDKSRRGEQTANKLLDLDQIHDQVDTLLVSDESEMLVNRSSFQVGASMFADKTDAELLQLRDQINMWVMNIGKISVTVAIQVGATIAMEAYPNNLRQTGSGVIVFVGRIGSILAPFLYNDLSEDKIVFKSTLITLAIIGFLVCSLTPLFLKTGKDEELCDNMDDIEEN